MEDLQIRLTSITSTNRDRIVYMVSDDRIDFLQARYHYSDRG
ncbi:MAG: type II toxin-antitoxin system YoeB family toxin [Coleofasciculus sp. C1-SOL-03]